MGRLDSKRYIDELSDVSGCVPWERLAGKTLALSGATGMIGTCVADLVMLRNASDGLGCRVVALGRSEAKARGRLPYFGDPLFSFFECDVAAPGLGAPGRADFVAHLASPTHPRQYAADPVGTIRANVAGLENMLGWAARSGGRLLLASSVEVYGENRGDAERFGEGYCGYIDCNTLRACYTESKRLGEAMCQAYRSQAGVGAVVARLARVYGPTLLPDDSKALSQFIRRALAGLDVVLKSDGSQRYSYLYAADAAAGLLKVLLDGADGEAYNLADPASDVSLRGLAELVAGEAGVGVAFEVPDAEEAAGYSKATVALMDASKANALGWRARYSIEEGVRRTLEMLGGRERA